MIDCKSTLVASIVLLSMAPAFAQDAAPAEPAPAAPVTAPAPLVSAGITITLDSQTDIERRTVIYQCDQGGFRVHYLNAAPNFLAIIAIEGQEHVFVSVPTGIGSRYVSGPYEWLINADEAALSDLRLDEDDAQIATCLAASNTP